MFANTSAAGLDSSFPDVCLTPTPAGPIPIPYPNLAASPMAVSTVNHILLGGAPAHNLGTVIPMTSGDEPGVATGVASGAVMGSSKHVTGAMTVLIGGMPASRLTSVSKQNSGNCVGARVTPSQVKVLLLAP